jgi:hypothetical protein
VSVIPPPGLKNTFLCSVSVIFAQDGIFGIQWAPIESRAY